MLNERIRELRKQLGYSQEQMARKLHVTQGAISQWENGLTVPVAEQLIALADAFGISVDELLDHQISDAKKEPELPPNIDEKLVDILLTLSQDEFQRVEDFVSGLRAGRKE